MDNRQEEFKGLHDELQAIISKFAGTRIVKKAYRKTSSGEIVKRAPSKASGETSHKTVETRAKDIHRAFRELRELGFNLQKAGSLSEKHMVALAQKWDLDGLANITITNKLSSLRIFCSWIGKKKMVKSMAHYFPDKPERHRVTRVAKHLRTPTALGINFLSIIDHAERKDPRLGLMFRLCFYFGLRAREAVMLKAGHSFKQFSTNRSVRLTKGTKSGRPRTVQAWPGDDDAAKLFRLRQDETVAMAKRLCGATRAVGWLDGEVDGLKQSMKMLYNKCQTNGITAKDLGFTLHDLRKDYAVGLLIQLGFRPPIAGGDLSEPREIRNAALDRAMNDLGHNDHHTGGAYVGGVSKAALEEFQEKERLKFINDPGY